MDRGIPLLVLAGAVAGAALAWIIEHLRSRARLQQREAVSAARLAAAETAAAAEQKLRADAERKLDDAQRARADLDKRLAVAEERVIQARQLIDEQKAFIERSRAEMENAFKALASDALQGSTDRFLDLAEQRWTTTREQAAADLESRRLAIETLLAPLRETLGRLEARTGEIERTREGAYASLSTQVQRLAEQAAALQERTTTLATALRGSQVRGRWGEVALRNIAELSGMAEHCDFEEQATAGDRKRPDMTVRLPGGRFIAVDSKAPLAAYLEVTEAADEATREAALNRHVTALRAHVRALAARDYAGSLGGGVDLVVMFLPGDPFLAAAFARDPDLQIEALRARVLIATPTTLVALLRTVAIYWQQRAMAENAEEIARAARELYERAAKFGHELADVGSGLRRAIEAYNRAVGSFEGRLIPMGRRLEDMKVTEQVRRDLETPGLIDQVPRELRQ
jgi:DNA recombination protein RmuC